MTRTSTRKPTIVQLADRIEKDIRSRGLRTGDSYHGLLETKRMLGVGTDSANRALQLLTQRGVLIRKQRKGAIVANLDGPADNCSIRRVRIIIQQEMLEQEGFFADGHLLGIQSELPDAEVVFNFLPIKDEEEYLEDLVNKALVDPEMNAFILASASFLTQQKVMESGLPAVVGGSLYPSITGIPCVDADHEQEARLAAEHLVQSGCRRILVLMRDCTLPGDRVVFDSLMRMLDAAGLRLSEVITRNLPCNPVEVQAEVLQNLQASDGKPGIIARSEPLAQGAADAIAAAGLRLEKDAVLVGSNVHRSNRERNATYPDVRVKCDPEERGKAFGRLLKRVVNQQPLKNCVFPMELVCPD